MIDAPPAGWSSRDTVVTAETSVLVPAPPALCFARLAEFPLWTRFMPASFRPVRGPERPLAVGDRFEVRLRGKPGGTRIQVVELVPERVLAWAGGIPGVLHAVHRFHFESVEGATRIRSVETWTGALAHGPIGAKVKRAAERIGREQLDGLARDLEAHPT